MNIVLLSFVVYLAGIITFLAPCTLPLIPVYFSVILQKGFQSTVFYTTLLAIGLGTSYVVLGVFAGSLGSLLIGYKQLFGHIAGVGLIIIGLLIMVGYSFTHVLAEQKNFSVLGTILYGVLFGVVWSGCIGPVLGGVLVIAASTQTAVGGGILLLVYALGLMTPLFIFSFVVDKSGKLPVVWKQLSGKGFTLNFLGKPVFFHSTNMITGSLFIVVGIVLSFDGASTLSSLFPDVTENIFSMEEKLSDFFGRW